MRTSLEKYNELKLFLQNLDESIAVAYSGGHDSSFLLASAAEWCRYPVFALTAESLFLHQDDLHSIATMKTRLNARFVRVSWDPFLYPEIIRNDSRRCYFCKKNMYKALMDRCVKLDISYIADGTHVDDIGEDRPGLEAIRELGINTPLCQFGLDKQDIRHLSLLQSLETWELRSQSCLATRISQGRSLDPEELILAGKIESMLADRGVKGSRCRISSSEVVISAPDTHKAQLATLLDEIKTVISDAGLNFHVALHSLCNTPYHENEK